MSLSPSNPKIASLIDRVKGLVMTPTAEWEKISAEPSTVKSLFIDYVMILSAIPAVCGFIGAALFGYGGYHVPIFTALMTGITNYIGGLVMVFIMGYVVNFLAPKFDGTSTLDQGFKVAAYAATASWVLGVFYIIPMLGLVAALVGLYSLYTLYTGLQVVTKVPEEKAVLCTAAVIGSMVVIGIVVMLLAHMLVPHPTFSNTVTVG